MLKKITSVIIAAAVLISFAVIFSNATVSIGFSSSNAAGAQGDTVDVQLNVSSNTGFNALDLVVEYDSTVMTPSALTVGAALSGQEGSTVFTDYNLSYSANKIILTAVSDSLISANGLLATVSFDISPSAALGQYAITPSVSSITLFNETTSEFSSPATDASASTVTVGRAEVLELVDGSSLGLNGGFVTGMELGSNTVTAVSAQFKNTSLVFKKLNGTVLTGNDKLATDCKVELVKNGRVIDSATFVLYGDVNGDGKINGMDAFIIGMIADGSMATSDLSEAALKAADITHDGSVLEDDFGPVEDSGVKKDVTIIQSEAPAEINSLGMAEEYIAMVNAAAATISLAA